MLVTFLEGRNSLYEELLRLFIFLGEIGSNFLNLLTQVILYLLDGDVWGESDDVLLVLKLLLQVNEPDVILNELDLLKQSSLLLDHLDRAESFSHHCNEHVHEDYKDKESS